MRPDLKVVQNTGRELAEARDASQAGLAKGGGGPHDPDMEARVARMEAAVQHIQTDLGEIKSDVREVKRDARGDCRMIFGALIVATLGLAGLMARGFGWL